VARVTKSFTLRGVQTIRHSTPCMYVRGYKLLLPFCSYEARCCLVAIIVVGIIVVVSTLCKANCTVLVEAG
jgi:hypothetical protein